MGASDQTGKDADADGQGHGGCCSSESRGHCKKWAIAGVMHSTSSVERLEEEGTEQGSPAVDKLIVWELGFTSVNSGGNCWR